LINNGLKPVSALSGGIIGNCCPPGIPGPAELAKPNSEGAAAKIKKDEAEAKARQAAVRYLGTVDCHWWPDAEAALIVALRADRNECVRYEAALALSRGCCCTKAVIAALTICVAGTEVDANPSENSERVRIQAEIALTQCLARVVTVVEPEKEKPPIEKPPERPPERLPPPQAAATGDSVQLAAYYVKEKSRPKAQILEEARRALEGASNRAVPSTSVPTGTRSLAQIWARANAPSSGPEAMPSSPVPPLAAEKRMEPLPMMVQPEKPAPQAEKYGGLLPALFHNTDSAPKPTVAWHPGTVSYVSTPVPSESSYQTTTRPPVVQPMPKEKETAPSPMVRQPVATPIHPPATDSDWLSVPKLMSVLKDSDKPSQREWAADCLSGVDSSSHAQAVPALLAAARSDSSPLVRVACIRTIDKMHAHGPEVTAALKTLSSDKDPSVQKEASQALSHVADGGASSAVLPVSGSASGSAPKR
jgi:hypothetical protein